MGVTAAIIGGGLLGLGASSLMSKKPSYSMPSTIQAAYAPSRPHAPELPESGDAAGGTAGNELMEAERQKEKEAAILRQKQAQEIFTSGLGAAGSASTSKKTLLGG